MKVLLVEDDKFHMNFLESAVRQALPEVSEVFQAENGAEGERMARRHLVNRVVMDLQMKDRNGIDAARTIWAERPEARIMFWSNYADEAYLRGIARIVPEDTSYGYVLKTANTDRLHLALRSVLVEGQIVVDREVHKVQQHRSRTHDALTDSEYAVLIDMSLGLSDKWIAKRQGMSLRTVQNRLLSIYDKLGVDDFEDVPGNLPINKRARAISRALNLRAINVESLASAETELHAWLSRQVRQRVRRI